MGAASECGNDQYAIKEHEQLISSCFGIGMGRATSSGFAEKNINQGMSTSPCRVTDPRKLESAAIG